MDEWLLDDYTFEGLDPCPDGVFGTDETFRMDA